MLAKFLHLWPHYCILCHQVTTSAVDICDNCKSELPWLGNCCCKCAQPLENTNQNLCGECLTKPPQFTMVISAFHYRFPIDSLILGLKFGSKLLYCKSLGIMLSETIKKRYANQLLPDLLLPVPLHYKRIAERGFNQALEIARIIAKSLQIPIDAKSCIRVRNTAAQAELKSDKRKANVARAFQCIKPIAAKHVAIVDDVVTTGNTVRELSKVLHKAGVERIDVWCIARA